MYKLPSNCRQHVNPTTYPWADLLLLSHGRRCGMVEDERDDCSLSWREFCAIFDAVLARAVIGLAGEVWAEVWGEVSCACIAQTVPVLLPASSPTPPVLSLLTHVVCSGAIASSRSNNPSLSGTTSSTSDLHAATVVPSYSESH